MTAGFHTLKMGSDTGDTGDQAAAHDAYKDFRKYKELEGRMQEQVSRMHKDLSFETAAHKTVVAPLDAQTRLQQRQSFPRPPSAVRSLDKRSHRTLSTEGSLPVQVVQRTELILDDHLNFQELATIQLDIQHNHARETAHKHLQTRIEHLNSTRLSALHGADGAGAAAPTSMPNVTPKLAKHRRSSKVHPSAT